MKLKTILQVSTSVAVIFTILYFSIGLFFYHFALNANATTSRNVGEKVYVPSPAIEDEVEQLARQADREFLQLNTPVMQTLTSHDNLQLKGYQYIQPEHTTNWVIAVHGYTGSARQMTRWNRQVYELGYNVLAPDLRGHGQSEGDYYGMGWLDQKDLQKWLDFLLEQEPDANVILYGVSMGASAVLNIAAEPLPINVKAIIADSGFSSVSEIFETQLNETLHLPSFPIMNAANTVAKWRINLDFYKASTVERVKEITLPIFYIHGEKDEMVPVENVYRLVEATKSPYKLWVVEDANHGEAVKVQPQAYKEKVQSFIEQYIHS